MGHFVSLDIYDLERAARNSDTARALMILARRPDLVTSTILHFPHPQQQKHAAHSQEHVRSIPHTFPVTQPPALGGNSGLAAPTDFLHKLQRWIHVPQQQHATAGGSQASGSDADLSDDAMTRVAADTTQDARDFIISVPESATAVATPHRSGNSAAASPLFRHSELFREDSLASTRALGSSSDDVADPLQITPPARKSIKAEKVPVLVEQDLSSAFVKEMHAVEEEPAVTKAAVLRPLTSVHTRICMSPLSWAIDNLNVDLIRAFLEAPLIDPNAPIAYVVKDRVGGMPMAADAAHTLYKYTLSPLEYAIVFKVCPHMGADALDKDSMCSVVDDLMELIMTVAPGFNANRKSDVVTGSGVAQRKNKKKIGGEPLLHLAIKYHSLYRGAQPVNVEESGRLMMDEERMIVVHEPHNNAISCQQEDEDVVDMKSVGDLFHGGRKVNEKIWCRRHRALMPLSRQGLKSVSQFQLVKQDILLRRLLEHEDMDLTAIEEVDGGNALHYAVLYDNHIAAQLLLDSPHWNSSHTAQKAFSALLEQRDRNGYTPLHLAVCCGRFEIALLLVQAGADYFVRNTEERAIDVIFQNRAAHAGFSRLAAKVDELEFRKVHAPRVIVH